MCSHVLVVDRDGSWRRERWPTSSAPGQSVDLEVDDPARAAALLEGMQGVAQVRRSDRGLVVDLDGVPRSEVVAALSKQASPSIPSPRRRLEDAFLSIVGPTNDPGAEWVRQMRRLRTWTCIAALAALPVVFSVSLYIDPPRCFREVNLFATRSGLNAAVAALRFMSQFFLVVVVAALAGETVSGEATWGTLRYLLVRPVSRFRLILSKIFVAYVLTLLAVLAIVGTALIANDRAGWQ